MSGCVSVEDVVAHVVDWTNDAYDPEDEAHKFFELDGSRNWCDIATAGSRLMEAVTEDTMLANGGKFWECMSYVTSAVIGGAAAQAARGSVYAVADMLGVDRDVLFEMAHDVAGGYPATDMPVVVHGSVEGFLREYARVKDEMAEMEDK